MTTVQRVLILSAFLGLACASTTLAAQRDELLVQHSPPFLSKSYEYRVVAEDGTVGTLGAIVPWVQYPLRAMIAPDNRQVRAMIQDGPIYDLDARGGATTVASGPRLRIVWSMFPGQDGDLITATHRGSYAEFGVWNGGRYDLQSTLPVPAPRGGCVDPLTGRIVFLSAPLPYSSGSYHYFFLDVGTGAATSVAIPFTGSGASQISYDPDTDTFVDLITDVSARIAVFVRFDRNGGVVASRRLTPLSSQVIQGDLVSASRRGRAVKYWSLVRRFSFDAHLLGLRADGSIARVGEVAGSRVEIGMLRAESESLVVDLARAPNDRTLRLSFPRDAGKPYVLAMSLTGPRFGPVLPDGRRVAITPDVLTAASLQGGIPGIIGPTIGFLDARGEATVAVNANRFGRGALGLKVWATAIVLDPKAPSGVAVMSQPKLFEMR